MTDLATYAQAGPWAAHAECRNQMAAMVMPQWRGTDAQQRIVAHVDTAKTICRRCTVAAQCRQWAMSDPDPTVAMIAGGLSPDERNRRRNIR